MPGWVKGCGIGCGVFLLLAVVSFVGCGYMFTKPFQDAIETREELEAAHGASDAYRPAGDGRIAPERMEAFLAVREALQEPCEELETVFAHFHRLDRMDESEVGTTEKIGLVLGTLPKALGMVGHMGEYAIRRNEALLDQGMSLGEYTYIYALAYYAMLGKTDSEPESGEIEIRHNEGNGPPTSQRVRSLLREMLRSQLADLTAAGTDPDFATILREEIMNLDDDHDRTPWQGALPPRIRTSLAPYRGRLESLWCQAGAPEDLALHHKGSAGLNIHTD